MAVEVILPKVDMDMATGKISKWFFDSGTEVRKGDLLFEIETDKAAMEIDAPASGKLVRVAGEEGVDIPVGVTVAWIYEEGESDTAVDTPASPQAAAPAAQQPAIVIDALATMPLRNADDVGIRATPLARRIARDAGLDLGSLVGSGPNGRILRADVEARIAIVPRTEPDVAPVTAPASCRVLPDAIKDELSHLFAEGSFERLPHSNMRRTVARRLVEAKSTIPHFYLTADCNIGKLLDLRAELNASAPVVDGKPDYKLSVNDMVIKAYAMALRAVPDANVSWSEDSILRHRHVDLAIAVSLPGGLITPIVRSAETKTLSAISGEAKDLAERARSGKLKGEEYRGGTAAVSNLGMFGVREFAAIINPPHATILAVGAGEKRAVVIGDDVTSAQMMTVTLSVDHRAVDGALGATLLARFRDYIQSPMAMLA